MRPGGDVGAVLRGAVGGDAARAAGAWSRMVRGGGGLGLLADGARFHRVEGYLLLWVRRQGGHDELEGRLAHRVDEVVRAHVLALGSVIRAATLLDAAGIAWATFKGPVLAEIAHGSPTLRSYKDVDLLVSRADFTPALAALASEGAMVLDKNVTHLLDLGAGQVHVRDRLGQNVDLHWGILYSRQMRAAFALDEGGLLERRQPVPVVGRQLPTFAAVDTVLHLCLHGALGGGHRLVWLKDIERTLTTRTPDWDELVEAAARAGLGVACSVMLRRTAVETGLELPSGLLRRLCRSPALRALDAAAVLAFAASRADTRGTPARLSARVARRDPRATWHELGARVASLRPANARLVAHPQARADGGTEAFDPDPAGRPLQHYLDWVAQGAR